MIPKDGLIEIIQCDENGKATFNTDIPMGSKLYEKEYSTDSHYILSDNRYPVIFEYQGQEVADVTIAVNNGDPIENRLIYGEIVGLKVDQSDKPFDWRCFWIVSYGLCGICERKCCNDRRFSGRWEFPIHKGPLWKILDSRN